MHFFKNSIRNRKKFTGFLEKFVGKNFTKYLIDQLKSNIKQDIDKPKFDEKKVKIDEATRQIVTELAKYNELSFNQKDLDLIIKYISFGKEHILFSDLLIF